MENIKAGRKYLWYYTKYSWIPKFNWFKPPKNKWFEWAYDVVRGSYHKDIDTIYEVWTAKWNWANRILRLSRGPFRGLLRWAFNVDVSIVHNKEEEFVYGNFDNIVFRFLKDVKSLSTEERFDELNNFLSELSRSEPHFRDMVNDYKKKAVGVMLNVLVDYSSSEYNIDAED